jgi:hypothetical protein
MVSESMASAVAVAPEVVATPAWALAVLRAAEASPRAMARVPVGDRRATG